VFLQDCAEPRLGLRRPPEAERKPRQPEPRLNVSRIHVDDLREECDGLLCSACPRQFFGTASLGAGGLTRGCHQHRCNDRQHDELV
jgi:hypothetical protein